MYPTKMVRLKGSLHTHAYLKKFQSDIALNIGIAAIGKRNTVQGYTDRYCNGKQYLLYKSNRRMKGKK
jgi:hypothetical protein